MTQARTERSRRLLGEFVGTAMLLTAIVGSGAMAERLTDDVGLQLLQNAISTAAALVALILAFGPISGAHFNPVVTLADRVLGRMDTQSALAYMAAQISGGVVGVMAANIMFSLPIVELSTTERGGFNLAFSEGIATIGLLLTIHTVSRHNSQTVVAFAVGAYIAGAFAFTSSTSFANPAVTLSRTLSDSFAGIEPTSVPGFIVAQVTATAVALVLIRGLLGPTGDPSPALTEQAAM